MDISAREARAIALALALSHPTPRLLVLHEPLGLLGLVREDFLLGMLKERVAGGAIVLCTANRLEDAAHLSGSVSQLTRGTWLAPRVPSAPWLGVLLRIRTPEPRRLVARLAEAPDITSVEWPGGQEVLVRGKDLTEVAQSVVANARAEAIRITALQQELPALATLSAARFGGAPLTDNPAPQITPVGQR